jgi:hypothetical protein
MLAIPFDIARRFPKQRASVLLQMPGRALVVSRTDLEQLTDHRPCSDRLLGEPSIAFEDQCDRFL